MITNQQHSPLEILYSISRELTASLDLHTVLSRVLELSTENIGAERASLIVLNNFGKPVDAAIIYDGKQLPATPEQMEDIIQFGLAGWVIRNRQPVLLANTHEDERWLVRSIESKQNDAPKSALCVPLMAQDQIVGALTIVHPRVNFFTSEQFKIQQAIADVSGIAIRNAQLYEDVQTARNRYHDLFEDSVDPILIADLNGKIVEANLQAVAVSEFSREELTRMNLSNLQKVPPEKMQAVMQRKSTDEAVKYESSLHCKVSGNLPVEVYASRIVIQSREHIQWIFRDISERKNLDSLRGDLSAMIYHDLRSPLANIISSLEILSSLVPVKENQQILQLLDIANRSANRMQRLINSLLDINRLEAGQEITQKTAVDVEQMINESVDIILPNIRNKQLEVEKLIPAVIPALLVDEDMIRRVIINLLENSAKFSPLRSRITIGAKLNGNLITLWVEDHGPGIPDEAREHIFEKFVQLRGEGSTRGLGLGLAFCRLAVQAHGGTIWVENLKDGGSRFIFTLPAALKD
jgi:PAS domain S-box-containing protein